MGGSRLLDLTGQRFGMLTVVCRASDVPKMGGKILPRWECLCDCGRRKIVRGASLRYGKTKSCGCSHYAVITKHGHNGTKGKTRTYHSWDAMIQRCTNPKAGKWPYYGARGIKVCKRWREYKNFLSDMGECPPGLTIERINNDGNYEPKNCKWATMAEQSMNKRKRGTALL